MRHKRAWRHRLGLTCDKTFGAHYCGTILNPEGVFGDESATIPVTVCGNSLPFELPRRLSLIACARLVGKGDECRTRTSRACIESVLATDPHLLRPQVAPFALPWPCPGRA